MIKWIKSKFFYHKLKMELFEALVNGDGYLDMFTKLATACKDMTPDDVKKEFLSALADKIHTDGDKRRAEQK